MLKDAIREAYLNAICERYGTEWVADHLKAEGEDLDILINLDDLIDRINCEIDLAADELEYDILTLDEEDEDEEDE